MVEALREEIPRLEVVRKSRPSWFFRLQKIVRRLTGGRADPYYWSLLNRWFAARLMRRHANTDTTVIAVVNSTLVAELAKHIRVINISDATFDLMNGFYENFSRLSKNIAHLGDDAERKAISRSSHNSFSSEWAAQSAIGHYGAEKSRVSVISWGCNLHYVEKTEAALHVPREKCRLLFIGGDWIRKGGDIALETAALLHTRGIPVELNLVGAKPTGEPDLIPGTVFHGFLSKAVPSQHDQLISLYKNSSFLFLPTRQDCTPMIFAEANAYGTPGVTRDVGGVGSVVLDGKNGFLLPEHASAADFAAVIERAWKDLTAYDDLRTSSRKEYEQRLNWSTWAKSVRKIVEDISV